MCGAGRARRRSARIARLDAVLLRLGSFAPGGGGGATAASRSTPPAATRERPVVRADVTVAGRFDLLSCERDACSPASRDAVVRAGSSAAGTRLAHGAGRSTCAPRRGRRPPAPRPGGAYLGLTAQRRRCRGPSRGGSSRRPATTVVGARDLPRDRDPAVNGGRSDGFRRRHARRARSPSTAASALARATSRRPRARRERQRFRIDGDGLVTRGPVVATLQVAVIGAARRPRTTTSAARGRPAVPPAAALTPRRTLVVWPRRLGTQDHGIALYGAARAELLVRCERAVRRARRRGRGIVAALTVRVDAGGRPERGRLRVAPRGRRLVLLRAARPRRRGAGHARRASRGSTPAPTASARSPRLAAARGRRGRRPARRAARRRARRHRRLSVRPGRRARRRTGPGSAPAAWWSPRSRSRAAGATCG